MLEKIFVLITCLSNVLLFHLLSYFGKGYFTDISTVEIMSYSNIFSMFLMLPYLFKRWYTIRSLFFKSFKLSLTVPASYVKVYSVGVISATNAIVFNFFTPIATVLMSFLFLKEFNKKDWAKYLQLILSFVGIIIYVGVSDISIYGFAYFMMTLHVFMRAGVNVFVKQFSKNRYAALFYSIFYYSIFSIIVFIFKAEFSIKTLFNYRIILISLLSLGSQLFLIHAYRLTKKLSSIQNLDYSKIVFTMFFSCFLHKSNISHNQILGSLIIIVSVFCTMLTKSQTNKVPTKF